MKKTLGDRPTLSQSQKTGADFYGNPGHRAGPPIVYRKLSSIQVRHLRKPGGGMWSEQRDPSDWLEHWGARLIASNPAKFRIYQS